MDQRFLVFGIQHAGKTTFAAALWHLVDSEEIPTAFKKGKHVGNFDYLEHISQSWADGYEVDRTTSQQVENIRINLLHSATGNEVTLEFDDLSGETFEKAFSARLCPEHFVDLAQNAQGLMLFISASRLSDSHTILDADILGDEEMEREEVNDEPDPPLWNPENAPLQVQLVDLLQSLRRPPFEKPPMKIAVVISAWDLVPPRTTSAQLWLEERYPLLGQYLKHSEDVADVRVYGVSAQGGQLSKRGDAPGPDREKLLKTIPPSNRIHIVGADVSDHDLTAPLLWLSGLEREN